MPATIAGSHLGLDTHANRPAANAAGQPVGALYSCSTHSLVYKTDGSTWATWATLGGTPSGSITASGYTQSTAKILGRSTASTGAIEEITVGSGLSLSAGSLTATGGAAGALTFLEAHTASSSATLDFTTFISSTYDTYLFEIVGIVPATNTVQFTWQAGTGGGPTYDTGANYESTGWYNGTADTLTGSNLTGGGASRIATSVTTTANYSINGRMYLYDPQSATFKPSLSEVYSMAAALYHWSYAGHYKITTAMTALRFLFSSGNIASGTIRVYGIAKS